MLKSPDLASSKHIIERYKAYQLDDLNNQLVYHGQVGSDPEVFIEDKKGDNIPAFDFLGSKAKPNRAPNRDRGNNAIYWDGFQAEFDATPSDCMSWHMDSIQIALDGLAQAAKKYSPGAKLSAKTVIDVTPRQLKSAKPEHVAFGCLKSYNAYGMSGLNLNGAEVLYRPAGGHIHLGIGKSTELEANKIVKAMDAVLGVAGVSLFASFDDPRRRQLYGLAGEYRLPPHGVEYRVLSNAWLFHPLIANIVFDLARSSAMFGMKGFLPFWECDESETIRIINECDVKAARKVLRKNEYLLKKILDTKYNNLKKTDFAFSVIIRGMESVIKDATDIEKNWDIGGTWKTHCDGPGKNVTEALRLKRTKF
jgi:hypothetical protein